MSSDLSFPYKLQNKFAALDNEAEDEEDEEEEITKEKDAPKQGKEKAKKAEQVCILLGVGVESIGERVGLWPLGESLDRGNYKLFPERPLLCSLHMLSIACDPWISCVLGRCSTT
jgi:hypothetical protein